MTNAGASSDPETLAAEAANMTDEELLDSWQAASDKETENLSPFLRSIVDEMDKRRISFR